ncbi:MAG: metalloregulator ArsR/SmtB family transcription factor [Anaerolineales bacterium]|nr:metalloregulator ArsR/SmtB family transcription factor [Anaerolineales bacterium]MCS7248017.1 metalloregulator ArsR/SmtB family transcription factor [Anaerolineales bacterium]MDW8161829.1 metalloregulator ArsR/SmtB family transcription factor [Anaerolineales bacterium]MDW8446599.1 metalloregulator ArsR/SmtB family transcription factor [Anaerolineales bacterium]
MDKETVIFSKALADETRQRILKLICCRWLAVNEIVAELNLTQPTISHHLALLREAGLVLIRQEGKFTYYTLNQAHLVSCCGRLLINFAPQSEISTLVQNHLDTSTSPKEP